MEELLKQFENDIADHELEVITDNGVNRIMRFKNKDGSSNQYFDILQTNGKLCYSGDMGDFIFTNHNNDMLAWFNGNTSLSYISEKCRTGGTKEYSEDRARNHIEMMVNDFCFDHIDDYITRENYEDEEEDKGDLLTAWQGNLYVEVVSNIDFENEATLHETAYDLTVVATDSIKFEIDTSEGLDCREYTHRFKWCVLAINKVAELYYTQALLGQVNE